MVDSRRFQRGEIGASLPPGVLRTYEDPRVIEAAWQRLEARRHSRGGVPWSAFVAAAAVLLGVGFGAGVLVTQKNAEPNGERRASGERPTDWRAPAGAAAAPVDAQKSDVEPEKERSTIVAPRRRALPSAQQESESIGGDLVVETLPSAPPAWLEFAERGEYRPAFDAALRGGEFEESALSSSSSEELMALADVARFAGRTGLAIRVLREVTVRFESDPNAPIAAMVLGNLLSQAGDTEGASRAYALNRRLSPSGDFAEDALFREFDMSISARDTERAQQLLRQYESLFSGGRHASEMRAELERLVAQSASEARDLEKAAQPPSDVFEIDGARESDGAPSAP